MKHLARFALLLIPLLLLLAPAPASAQPGVPEEPGTFLETDCWFTQSTLFGEGGDTMGRQVTCGYVTVPELYADLDGPLLQVAVAIFAGSPNAPSDPLFVVQGGPGGSGIDFFSQGLFNQAIFTGIERDIVIVEQRGTLYARPNLLCTTEFRELFLEQIERSLSEEEEMALTSEVYTRCRQRLLQEGINLDAFDSLENAADMELVRQALGYDTINFYGVSYGTLLALQLMRLYPDGLRSVILDAVVAPQNSFIAGTLAGADRAYDLLFATCAEDASCQAAYPDLEERFYTLVERLNDDPTHVTLTDLNTGDSYRVPFNGDDLLDTLFIMLYDSSLLPGLPLVLAQAEAGDYDLVEMVLSLQIFDQTLATGMYYSVVCAELGEIPGPTADSPGVHPALQEIHRDDLAEYAALCRLWDVEPLPDLAAEPVASNVPTLLVSGRFDPITPPANAALVAESLDNAYLYTAPFGAHGAALTDECAVQVMETFLDNPSQPPDPPCRDAEPEFTFIEEEDLVLTNFNQWLNYFLFALTDDDYPVQPWLAGPLLYLLGLLLLSSALLVWPLAWLVNRLRERPTEPVPPLLRLGGWAAVLMAFLVLLFTVGLVWATGATIAEAPELATFGLLSSFRPLFILPVLILLGTLGILFVAVFAWATRTWSLPRRLYYTLLALAALTVTIILVNMEFVTAIF